MSERLKEHCKYLLKLIIELFMKNKIRNWLQKLLGFRQYLFIFSLYSIKRFERGKYEKEFMHFIKLIDKEGIVLDIGANIGITAAPLAMNLEDSEIHAFEPILENFTALERVIRYLKLSNVKLYNLALGNENGQLKMIMPRLANARMQGLSKAYQEDLNEKGEVYTVELRKLDEIYATEKNIKAMKIDVENFEYEVLKGSKGLLERNRPLIYCELWDNENRQYVFDFLSELGYKKYVFDQQKDTLSLLSLIDDSKLKLNNNFFFIYDKKKLSKLN